MRTYDNPELQAIAVKFTSDDPGIRRVEMDRECLARDLTTVDTRFGPVRVKIARRGAAVMNVAPEFDDCLRAAESSGRPVKEIYAEAVRACMNARAAADDASGLRIRGP